MIALPWTERTDDVLDVAHARRILDEDHYGLEEVKDRILDYIGVLSLVERMEGPILCLVGPPGVGKTSLGRSVARALGRKFVRMSLGGVRDEAEIRGHRRTYIGSMPGRVIQAMRRAEVVNPVILLDEVDKLGTDYRGDPAAALLEVLDPEQNKAFNDHYLEVDYDLSQVLFLTTANYLPQVPEPLRDRMEIIRLPGYLDQEKHAIARQFLVPKQLRVNGLDPASVEWESDVVPTIVQNYTREAGVRELERRIGRIARKLARRRAEASAADASAPPTAHTVEAGELHDLLGTAPYDPSLPLPRGQDRRGDGARVHDRRRRRARDRSERRQRARQAAAHRHARRRDEGVGERRRSATRARAPACSASTATSIATRDLHVHIPAGATPKDGPSAGIAIATAIVSALTGVPVRGDVAMTGEITLRGRVLAIGGLKEKAVAAHRNAVRHVLIPHQNLRDVEELPEEVRAGLNFHPVKTMDDVLALALVHADFAAEVPAVAPH